MRPVIFGMPIVSELAFRGNTMSCSPGVTDYLRSILFTSASAEIPFHVGGCIRQLQSGVWCNPRRESPVYFIDNTICKRDGCAGRAI